MKKLKVIGKYAIYILLSPFLILYVISTILWELWLSTYPGHKLYKAYHCWVSNGEVAIHGGKLVTDIDENGKKVFKIKSWHKVYVSEVKKKTKQLNAYRTFLKQATKLPPYNHPFWWRKFKTSL